MREKSCLFKMNTKPQIYLAGNLEVTQWREKAIMLLQDDFQCINPCTLFQNKNQERELYYVRQVDLFLVNFKGIDDRTSLELQLARKVWHKPIVLFDGYLDKHDTDGYSTWKYTLEDAVKFIYEVYYPIFYRGKKDED